MSLANLSIEDVLAAETDAYLTCAFRLSYLFGEPAIERMLQLPPNGLKATMEGRTATVADAPLLAATAFDYAWLGKAPRHGHVDDLVTDLAAIGQFFSVDSGMDAHDRSLPYSVIGGIPSNEILASLCRAAHARWAISSDMDVSLPDLAALARVSDKTIRMAANPKVPGALKTKKLGNRTVVSPEDALAWLSRRPDFRPTDTSTAAPGGALVAVPDQLRNARQSAESAERFAAALAASGIPQDTWMSLEGGAGHPDLAGLEAGRLIAFARHLELLHPEEFARRVIEHAYDNRSAKDAERRRRELAKLSAGQR
jgi:hypothetical protein